MKNKKISIVYALILLLIIIIIFVLIFMIKNDNHTLSNSSNSRNVVEIGKKIKEIQEINGKLIEQNFNKEKTIVSDYGLTCYEYKKEDYAEIVSKFSNLYHSINGEKGGIILDASDSYDYDSDYQNFSLYVCLAESCRFEKIEDFSIVSEDDTEINVKINAYQSPAYIHHYQKNERNEWKFGAPMIRCDSDKLD